MGDRHESLASLGKDQTMISRPLLLASLPLLFLWPATSADARDRFGLDARVCSVYGCTEVVVHSHGRRRGRHRDRPFIQVGFHAPITLACGCRKVWNHGHYRVVRERVRGRGCYERVWVPARFGTRICVGRTVRFQISAGYYKRVYRPGPVRFVTRRAWEPAGYVIRGRCRSHRLR